MKARSEFPNVWGEYKHHSNPDIQGIQGTTIPRDIDSFCPPTIVCMHEIHVCLALECACGTDPNSLCFGLSLSVRSERRCHFILPHSL